MGHSTNSSEADPAQVAAAILIQRLWRSKTNIVKKEYMTPETRWDDAAVNVRFDVERAAAEENINSPRRRWKRAGFLVMRLHDQNKMLLGAGIPDTGAENKMLETQHWLELVDAKHRYGSNLKYYHKRWQEEDTKDNFFRWLDHGSGKNLSLDQCPREQLEKEVIIYLSSEQRLNYLVKINEEGKLLWAKNNQPVDTTAGHWKDSGNGQGIIPENLPSRAPRPLRSISTTSSNSSVQDEAATHYLGEPTGKYRWTRYLRRHLTPRGLMERLLRKTVRRNTWIYAADKDFNLFIGIKETGAFQHSSLIAGGRVTSAGLISVKGGVIHTLSPLSGHYRTSINHFHKFIDVLTRRGVDMHKVQISKAEAALWGIEHLGKAKQVQGNLSASAKEMVQEAPKRILAWKKDVLEGRRKRAQ